MVSLKWEKDGCLVKTFLAKTLLREKCQGRKEYIQLHERKRKEKMRLTEVKFQMGDVPCVGYGFTR